MNRIGKQRFRYRSIMLLALGWLLMATIIILALWPDLPQSKLIWVLLVLFGPPLYVLGEAFFDWLFSERHGHSISSSGLSFKRILFALPVVIVLTALSWSASWLLTRSAA